MVVPERVRCRRSVSFRSGARPASVTFGRVRVIWAGRTDRLLRLTRPRRWAIRASSIGWPSRSTLSRSSRAASDASPGTAPTRLRKARSASVGRDAGSSARSARRTARRSLASRSVGLVFLVLAAERREPERFDGVGGVSGALRRLGIPGRDQPLEQGDGLAVLALLQGVVGELVDHLDTPRSGPGPRAFSRVASSRLR